MGKLNITHIFQDIFQPYSILVEEGSEVFYVFRYDACSFLYNKETIEIEPFSWRLESGRLMLFFSEETVVFEINDEINDSVDSVSYKSYFLNNRKKVFNRDLVLLNTDYRVEDVLEDAAEEMSDEHNFLSYNNVSRYGLFFGVFIIITVLFFFML